jgi:hypothetical protein
MGMNRKLMSAAGLVAGLAATFSLVAPASAVADDSPWDRGGRTPGADSVQYLSSAGDDRGTGCHDGDSGSDSGSGSGSGGSGEGTDDSPWD